MNYSSVRTNTRFTVDPDETAHEGAGSTLFTYILVITKIRHFCWCFKGSIIMFCVCAEVLSGKMIQLL